MSQHIKQKVLRKTFLTRHWELMFLPHWQGKTQSISLTAQLLLPAQLFSLQMTEKGPFKILGKKDYTFKYNVHVAST